MGVVEGDGGVVGTGVQELFRRVRVVQAVPEIVIAFGDLRNIFHRFSIVYPVFFAAVDKQLHRLRQGQGVPGFVFRQRFFQRRAVLGCKDQGPVGLSIAKESPVVIGPLGFDGSGQIHAKRLPCQAAGRVDRDHHAEQEQGKGGGDGEREFGFHRRPSISSASPI